MTRNLLWPACLCLLLAGCGSSPFAPKDGAPTTVLDPNAIPDAVPRPELVTRAGNTSPYTVLGKTYHLLPSSHGYQAEGIASWYGTKFHGRPTANGEIYSLYEMTAAHRTLPIPSYVEVVNLDNGRKAVVRVNDRGPFHADRIIDLSYAAAVKLGYERAGTARVSLRTVQAGEPLVDTPVDKRAHQYFLQAGSFRSLTSAQNLCSELIRITGEAVKIEASETPGFFRVRIGPLTDKKRVEALTAQLVGEGMPAPRLLTR